MTSYEWYKENSGYRKRSSDNLEKLYDCKFNSEEFFCLLSKCKSLNIKIGQGKKQIQYNKNKDVIYFFASMRDMGKINDSIKRCCCLEHLKIQNGEKIPKSIWQLKDLKFLELINCNLKNDFSFVEGMNLLEGLVLDRCEIDTIPEFITELKNLEVLSVMHTQIKVLPENLFELKRLKYLGLNGLELKEIPSVIFKLKELESLYLGQTHIEKLPNEIRKLKKLCHLAIWETNIDELPEWLCEFDNLQGIYAGRTKRIKKLPKNIGNLKRLKKLYIDGTGVTELPHSFGNLMQLEDIILSNTKIRKFPKLNKLPNLKRCDLSYMTIERIPREFINVDMPIYLQGEDRLYGLILTGTKLLRQPMSLFTHDKEFILAYYEEEKIHLNETKIVFLGDGEAGKSHIIQRLKNDGKNIEKFEEEATPGIAISQKQCVIEDERINLQIWDFGGQEIMHSMHRFFLTERTLYVIIINARDNTQDERAKYWLNNIKSFANGCPVILVLNKMDQNPSASINERLLRDDYPQIVDTIKMSALNDDKEVFLCLESTILNVVKTFDSYAMDFPISWNNVKTTLTEMNDNYIIDERYRAICKNNNVEDEQIQNWLLDWFHDLGVSFNYRKKDLLLGGYMILKPNWITNAIYIILFNGASFTQNGIISINSIVELLSNPPKSVETIKYNIIEVPYILGVMRRFEISYSVDNDYEFIPMMCNRNQHEEAEKFIMNNSMEYYMEYEYLPNNVLHKLMIKMQKDIDKDKIWLTGMITQSRDNYISALIRMHNNSIEIFVQSIDEEFYPAREYISQIREILISINQELNLKAEDMIVYKEDNLSEKIKYSLLLIHLSSGQKEYFSPVFRKKISIKKILGLVEKEDVVDMIMEYCNNNPDITYQMVSEYIKKHSYSTNNYEEFENELLECCTKLQGNTLQIQEGKENDRNTYLKDLLSRNKQYQVFDQTLNGLSANTKNAGELDLLVKDSKLHPFSIIEALTLKCVKKQYLAEHINKIYNYDTWGLPYNYLVVYAETDKFESFCIRYKDYITKYEYPFPLLEVKERTVYTEIRVMDTVLLRNGKKTIITHIVISIK